MKKIFLSLLVALSTYSFSAALAADIVIGFGNDPVAFTENNQKITLENGGLFDFSASSVAAISGAGSLTGLQVEISGILVSTNNNNTNSAISITDSAMLSRLIVGSASTIYGSGLNGLINLAGGGGSTYISLSQFASIQAVLGAADDDAIAINSNTIANTDLLITVAKDASIFSVGTTNGSAAINMVDSDGGSSLRLGNAGAVDATNMGVAINISGNNAGTIINLASGQILGKIVADIGRLNVVNIGAIAVSAGTNAIELGTNAGSTLWNVGSIIGNVAIGGQQQSVALYAGSEISGDINTAADNMGKVTIVSNAALVSNGNFGGNHSLAFLELQSGSSLNLATHNNSINAGAITMDTDSVLTLGTGALAGTVFGFANNRGIVNLNESRTLAGDLGIENLALNTISVADFKTIEAGDHDIRASTINIGFLSFFNSSGDIVGNLMLQGVGHLNLAGGATTSGEINGVADGDGNIEVYDGVVTMHSSIGASHSIETLSIFAGSQLNIGNSDDSNANIIKAIETNVQGQLNLLDATTITGDINMNGSSAVVNFGADSHIINGDFNTSNGGTISTEITSATSAGNITATVADIVANTKLNVTNNTSLITKAGASYVVVAGGAGSVVNAITDANINVNGSGSNSLGLYKYSSAVLGNSLILNIEAATLNSANANQANAFNAIAYGDAGTSGALYTLKQYLDSVNTSAAQKTAATNSAMAQVDNSSNRLAFDNAATSLDFASNRLQSLYNASNITYACSDKEEGECCDYRNALWAQTFGASNTQDNTSLSEGYKANVRGVTFGGDYKIDYNSVIGISGSYATSDIKSQSNLKKTDINSYQFNIYGGYHNDNYFVNSLVGVVFNQYKSNRSIAVAGVAANADYNGRTYIARLETGFNKNLGKGFVLTPTAMITAAQNSTDDYQEKGADTLNLAVRNKSYFFLEPRAGLTLSNSFTVFKSTIIQPEIFTSYGYDLAAAKQKVNSNFIGQAQVFDVTANKIAPGSLKLGAGAKIYSSDALSLHLNYVAERRSGYKSNLGMLKVKYNF